MPQPQTKIIQNLPVQSFTWLFAELVALLTPAQCPVTPFCFTSSNICWQLIDDNFLSVCCKAFAASDSFSPAVKVSSMQLQQAAARAGDRLIAVNCSVLTCSSESFLPAGKATGEKPPAKSKCQTSCSLAYCRRLLTCSSGNFSPAGKSAGESPAQSRRSSHLLTCSTVKCSPARPLGAFLELLSTLAELCCLAPQPLGSPDVFLTFCSVLVDLSLITELVVTIFIFSLYFLTPAGPASLTFFGGMMTAPVMSVHPLLLFFLMSVAATQ